jgi:hypothetical protein
VELVQRHVVFDRGIKKLRGDYVYLIENVSPLNTEKLIGVTYILAVTGSNLTNQSLLYFFLFFHTSPMKAPEQDHGRFSSSPSSHVMRHIKS